MPRKILLPPSMDPRPIARVQARGIATTGRLGEHYLCTNTIAYALTGKTPIDTAREYLAAPAGASEPLSIAVAPRRFRVAIRYRRPARRRARGRKIP